VEEEVIEKPDVPDAVMLEALEACCSLHPTALASDVVPPRRTA